MGNKYSCAGLVAHAAFGHFLGFFVGSIEGVVGSVAVPTSACMSYDNLGGDVDGVFAGKQDVYERVSTFTYHYSRLPTRFSWHLGVLYKIGEDIANRGDAGIGLLAVPIVISAGYEVHRWAKEKRYFGFKVQAGPRPDVIDIILGIVGEK